MSDTLYRDALYSHILSGGSDGQISSSGGGSSAFSPSSAGANPTCGAGSCARAGVVDALLDAELHLLDAFAGLSAVDDAHKRLFPFDSAGLSDTQHLTEQHLRQLLHQAGDEYLAAKSARASKRAGAGISSGGDGSSGGGGSSKEKARNRRRRQRADADPTDTGGDSAFDSAGAAGVGAGGEGTAGIRQSEGFFSSSSYSQDPEGVADFYDDVSAKCLGIIIPTSLCFS